MKLPIFGKDLHLVSEKLDLTVSLTPLGKQKAEKFSLEGPKFDVLASLLEEGTMTLSELSSKTGMSVNKLKEVCKSLAASGYIKFIKVPS